jgi:hypothetical protein
VLIWQHEQVTASFFEQDEKGKSGLPRYINRMTNQQSQQSGLNDQPLIDTVNGTSYDEDPYQWAIDAGLGEQTATQCEIDALHEAQTGNGAVDPFAQFSNGATNGDKPLDSDVVSNLSARLSRLAGSIASTQTPNRYLAAAKKDFASRDPSGHSVLFEGQKFPKKQSSTAVGTMYSSAESRDLVSVRA